MLGKFNKKWRKGGEHDWYLLQGVSFAILPSQERDIALSEFSSLLSNAKQGVLLVRRIEDTFSYSSYSIPVFRNEFYLRVKSGTHVLHFNARKVEPPHRPRSIGLRNPFTLVLENGMLARVLTVYRYSSLLPEGFAYVLLSEASEIALIFREIGKDRALPFLEMARRRKINGGRGTEETWEAMALEELASSIMSGSSLIELFFLLILTSPGMDDLNEKERRLRALLRGFGLDAEAVPIQKELYNFETCLGFLCAERSYTSGESMKALFPLIDEELFDPGGVFLGFSGTGSPILLDLWSKHNYNFAILGTTGSGKSMAAKLYLSRLRSMDPTIPIVGIDPESEYSRIAEVFGAEAVEIQESQKLGLDPVKLMKEGAIEIEQLSEILAEIYGIPERLQGILRKELFRGARSSGNLMEFIERAESPEIRRYLQGAGIPPDSNVFEGTSPKLKGSVIFGMRGIKSRRIKLLITAMIAPYTYNKLLSRAEKSVLFIDEAWLLMETPSIASLLEGIARRGRKHGIAFLYITQRAEDLALKIQGRAILEQSSTVLLLKQEPQGTDLIKEIYKLSDAESELLANFPIGTGILRTDRKRITIKIFPTEKELRLFSTSIAHPSMQKHRTT
ncbi:MAG: DUF87 domain-containing protein [Fervidicoccaceae archaeon]